MAFQSDVTGDLAVKPETENPYDDKNAASKRIERALSADRLQRSMFERDWFRNILFIAGIHWTVYDRGQLRPRRLPAFYPRSQTNKVAEKYNDIVSTVTQSRPVIRHWPETDSPEDFATAEISEQLRDVLYAESRIEDRRANLAGWVAATGTGFLLPYYDPEGDYGKTQKPYQECKQCGESYPPSEVAEAGDACPNCGATEFAESTEQFEDFDIGSFCGDVVGPFEIRVDHRITEWQYHRRFVRQRRYDVEFAKSKWPDIADSIHEDTGNDLSQYYLDVLAHVTSNFNTSTGGIVGGGPGNNRMPKVTVYEIFELPSEDFPEGLHAIRVGHDDANVVECKPLEFEYGAGRRKGQKFLPLIPFFFDRVPGRFWGKTRLDDLIPLQTFRNVVEANLRLTIQRMGNPIWLNPKGSGAGILTGEPGQVVEYNPTSVGGTSFAKPERLEASLGNIQPAILLIKLIDDSMERVSGQFFVNSGDPPPGVTAASALAFLNEKATKAMSPILREWARGWATFEQYGLEIARANWDDERIQVIAGKNREWEVKKFTKADLSGAISTNIDYESSIPKSQATERANISLLAQLGAINPADPEVSYRILKTFGATGLKGSMDLDVRAANKEFDAFMSEDEEHKDPQVHPWVDNSIVHFMQHVDAAKTDEFNALPPERQQAWLDHIKLTVDDIILRRGAMQAAMIPDSPDTSEMGSAAAQEAAAATMQSGGIPQGQMGVDPRLNAHGGKKPVAPQGPQPTPDIAASNLEGGQPLPVEGAKSIAPPRPIAPESIQ